LFALLIATAIEWNGNISTGFAKEGWTVAQSAI
jgi:hypothetical protein